MTLEDTATMMLSQDYKERFKAEYYQLSIRLEKLSDMLEKWDDGTLEFTPTCDSAIYLDQMCAMLLYLQVLKRRAEIEGVELEEGDEECRCAE